MRLKKHADKTGPEPPRNTRDEKGVLTNPRLPEGVLLEPWPLDHVEFISAPDVQKVTPRLIRRAKKEGWGAFDGSKFKLDTRPKVTFKVLQEPGLYCCHCEQPLEDEFEARDHVASEHAGVDSPDPANPSGYRDDRFYVMEKVS